jgi:hypothetical protein
MICPHCRTEVNDKASVCVGCHAEIVRVLTSGELKALAVVGALLGVFLNIKFFSSDTAGVNADRLFELAMWAGVTAAVVVFSAAYLFRRRITFVRKLGPR